MLSSILKAILSYQNGAEFWDIVHYTRGIESRVIHSDEVREQLHALVKAGVIFKTCPSRYLVCQKMPKEMK